MPSYSLSSACPGAAPDTAASIPRSCGWATAADDFLNDMLFPVLRLVLSWFRRDFLLMILIPPKIIREWGGLLLYLCLWDVQTYLASEGKWTSVREERTLFWKDKWMLLRFWSHLQKQIFLLRPFWWYKHAIISLLFPAQIQPANEMGWYL